MSTPIPQDGPHDDALARQREELLKHFKEWSGGFTPDECEDHEIDTYIELARPGHIDAALARELLTGVPTPADASVFTIHGEVDLSEKMTADELESELEYVMKLAREFPQAHHTVREHPEWGGLLFIVYSGPELTDDNGDAFDAAVLKYGDD